MPPYTESHLAGHMTSGTQLHDFGFGMKRDGWIALERAAPAGG